MRRRAVVRHLTDSESGTPTVDDARHVVIIAYGKLSDSRICLANRLFHPAVCEHTSYFVR